MVVPAERSTSVNRKDPYAEAASRPSAVSKQSLDSRVSDGAGHSCSKVVACSNHAFEFAAAYGLRRTAKPLRVLSAAQRGRSALNDGRIGRGCRNLLVSLQYGGL